MKYYVYAHSNEKYGVFYVGKGSGKRLYTTGNRGDFWKRIARKYGYTASILCECKTEDEAYQKEIEFITRFKESGQCAANFTNGGDGVRVDKRWWNDKISEALKGKVRPTGKENLSYKDFATKEELYAEYVENGLSIIVLAKKYNVSPTTIWERLRQFEIPIRDIKKRGKTIVCTTHSKEFTSITEAARFYGLHRENIRKVLSGKYSMTGGLHFSYRSEDDE